MKTGLLFNSDPIPGNQLADCARRAETLGFDSLWLPELFGREPFVTAGALLAATRNIQIGTAIANVYVRDAMATKAAAQTLRDLYGDRFNLGLGLSNTVGNTLRGHEWLPPQQKLDQFFSALAQARLSFKIDGMPPTYLAAHGPKLLELAAKHADGAFMYLATSAFISEAKALLGPDKELLVMQPCAVSDSREQALHLARRAVSIYTELANYRRAWRAQGFAESDYVNGPSDRLLQSLVALGTLADGVPLTGDNRVLVRTGSSPHIP